MLSSNHPSHKAPKSNKLCIWIFHDARPGHLNQLEGLANRLTFHINCKIYWFDVNKQKLSIRNFLFTPEFLKSQTKPDLIIGAGHSTHLSVLIAGYIFKAFTSIIMKPSLPLFFFDSIMCPKHDDLQDSKKVLSTFGPINKIDKLQVNNLSKHRFIKLILLGGESKHYYFDSVYIIEQIKDICLAKPDDQWILSNSPRTPQEMNHLLRQLDIPNLLFYDYKHDNMGALQDILLQTKFTWITPDSMSMIFEALTAGSQVGLIHCKPKNTKRVVRQVRSLVDEGYIIDIQNKADIKPQQYEIPWEADRAALWLLNQYKASHMHHNTLRKQS